MGQSESLFGVCLPTVTNTLSGKIEVGFWVKLFCGPLWSLLRTTTVVHDILITHQLTIPDAALYTGEIDRSAALTSHT